MSLTVTDLPAGLAEATDRLVTIWEQEDRVSRVWKGDPSVWTGSDEDRWLGWLHVIDSQLASLATFDTLREEIRGEQFEQAVLLGMGGSSLCPDVLRRSFGRVPDAPDLHVLDSTDPGQIRTLDSQIRYGRTLFIVSSKSGMTLEPNILHRYFAARVKEATGSVSGRQFIAITDPGSALEQTATAEGFRQVFHGVPSIGGRFSALSHFGMVPAAVMGIDVGQLLGRAAAMCARCVAEVPLRDNPGAMLGLILGAAAQQGRDKVTFVISPAYASLGAWLEQLLAESTGKEGGGLIPVDGELVGPPEVYGRDRLFVYLRDEGSVDRDQDDLVEELERAEQPVIRLGLSDGYDLGAEFFRWEFATAVAGSVLGINPFDQPDVEASKVATRRLTDAYDVDGRLPSASPLARGEGLVLFADPENSRVLQGNEADVTVEALVRAHCGRIASGDYVALLAFLEMTVAHSLVLQRVRSAIRKAFDVATCVGFGPRFLHSTGQAYKGGPNTGIFFQFTCDDAVDLPVPGHGYSFSVVKAAQAHGDFQVLSERGRRALRVHLHGDTLETLGRFADVVDGITQESR